MYELNGKRSGMTKYIQKAIIDVMMQEEKQLDEVIIFLTPEARKQNWLTTTMEDLKLKDVLLSVTNEAGITIKDIGIRSEQSEDEIWNLFELMIEHMEEGDRIIFDITHSFRFQPMLAMLAVHFARIVKKVEVEAVYYGAYLPNVEQEVFPIIDLTPFTELQDWITNIYAFSETGRGDLLTEWMAQKQSSIRKLERAAAADLKPLEQLTGLWKKHSYIMQTNRSMERQESANKVLMKIKEIEGAPIRPAFKPLVHAFDNLKESIEPLSSENRIVNDIHSVEWSLENGLYQQAMTIASELAITATCLLGNKELVNTPRKEANQVLKNALTFHRKNPQLSVGMLLEMKEYHAFLNVVETGFEEWDVSLVETVVKQILQHKGFLSSLHLINDYRNDINHAGFNASPVAGDKLVKNFKKEFNTFKEELVLMLNMEV